MKAEGGGMSEQEREKPVIDPDLIGVARSLRKWRLMRDFGLTADEAEAKLAEG